MITSIHTRIHKASEANHVNTDWATYLKTDMSMLYVQKCPKINYMYLGTEVRQ